MTSAKRRGRRIVAIMFGGSTARSRDQHVADLVEAAYQSFEIDETVSPEQQLRLSFSNIQPPVDPDGAAMPVLNGRVFGAGAVVAEGDEGSKSN